MDDINLRRMDDLVYLLLRHPEYIEAATRPNASEKAKERALGYKSVTPLIQLHQDIGFDLINQIPVDYMHTVLLGVVKDLAVYTFQKEIGRKMLEVLNPELRRVSVPREIQRMTRGMMPGQMKASEWKMSILAYFHLIARVVHHHNPGPRRDVHTVRFRETHERLANIWADLAYLIRAYLSDDEDYGKHSKEDLLELRRRIYARWQHVLGIGKCTYNLHLLLAHADVMREHGLWTQNSCFWLENWLGKLKTGIQPGTISAGKQGMQNLYLSNSGGSKRPCIPKKLTIRAGHKPSAQRRDDWVVTKNQSFYQLISKVGDTYVAKKAKTSAYNFPWVTPTTDFTAVGVRRLRGFHEGGKTSS